MQRAVVLLSGGMDSAVTAACAQTDGLAVHALSVRYGQRHAAELAAAARVAAALGVVEHRVVDVDLRAIGGSALTSDAPVPLDTAPWAIGGGIPSTYVPARNTILLSVALGWAEVLGARDIYIGATAVDYSGYPDCRPEFLEAFERMANLGTRAGVEGQPFHVRAPLLARSKADIVRLGLSLNVDFALTVSCYAASANGVACGRCDACQLRLKGFREAGATDPARYQERQA